MPGTYTDFVIDDKYFHTGLFEGVTQNLALFNEVSNGAVRLVNEFFPGHYNQRILYKTLEDSWTRRNITVNTAITSGDTKKVEEVAQIGVKFNAKLYLEQTIDSFRKNFDPAGNADYQEISNNIGQATAVGRLKQQVNQALLCARAALVGQAASLHQVTVSSANYSGKLNSGDLNTARAKLGDKSGAVRVLVMHSKAYFDLVGNQVADKVTGVSDFNLREGTPLTFGYPVLVIDSSALVKTIGSGSSAYNEYYTLGLVEDGVTVTVSERETMYSEVKTGYENLQIVLQGEGSHNLEVKGFKWDVANGGVNPTEAAMGTGTNWDLACSSVKNRAGFVIAHR